MSSDRTGSSLGCSDTNAGDRETERRSHHPISRIGISRSEGKGKQNPEERLSRAAFGSQVV